MNEYDAFEGLHGALGMPDRRVSPADAFFASLGADIDTELRAVWSQEGWSRYSSGAFWIVDPRTFADLVQDWPALPADGIVFGRTAFADLFVLKKGEVSMFDPQRGILSDLGPSVDVFLNSTLDLDEFKTDGLRLTIFARVRARLGDLEADECYGLFPALPLGGNEDDPRSYRRVKLREYLAILAQMQE